MKIHEKLFEYDPRFSKDDIELFERLRISPSQANEYGPSFSATLIFRFISRSIPSDKAHEFWPSFENDELGGGGKESIKLMGLEKLIETDLSLKDALRYIRGVSYFADEIVYLWKNGINGEKAEQYMQAYHKLTDYTSFPSLKEMVIFHKIGINPEDIDSLIKKRNSEFNRVHGIMIGYLMKKKLGDIDDYEIIGTGNHSIILLDKKRRRALKFCEGVEKEVNLLKKVHSKNVVPPLDYIKGESFLGDRSVKIGVELEYIDGESLADKLRGNNTLSKDQVLKYGYDIFNGLFALRRKGIYHKDVHDRNIMINKRKDRAVIIDLGAATENPDEDLSRIYWWGTAPPLNRSFGGNNDLISLGQLMYRMATGHNLFNEGYGASFIPEVKNEIKKTREISYKKKLSKLFKIGLSRYYIKDVRQNVKNKDHKDLADIIIELLDDDITQQPSLDRYSKMEKRFKKFGF